MSKIKTLFSLSDEEKAQLLNSNNISKTSIEISAINFPGMTNAQKKMLKAIVEMSVQHNDGGKLVRKEVKKILELTQSAKVSETCASFLDGYSIVPDVITAVKCELLQARTEALKSDMQNLINAYGMSIEEYTQLGELITNSK